MRLTETLTRRLHALRQGAVEIEKKIASNHRIGEMKAERTQRTAEKLGWVRAESAIDLARAA